MFRGAIEAINVDSISGWVYSDDANLTGRTLLAFVGDACVGAGKVDVFRQDLKDAGLGDGRFGFSFGITVDDSTTAPLVVKFESSDAILLAPDGDIVIRGGDRTALVEPAEFRLRMAQLSWLAERGVVKPIEFILLRDLLSYGYCSSDVPAGEGGIADSEIGAAFGALLSLATQANVEVSAVPITGTLAAAIAEVASERQFLPVIGLFSTGSIRLKLQRGSHLRDAELLEAETSLAQIRVRSPKLTLLDSRLEIMDVESEKGTKYLFVAKLQG
jgi:hypothetical protein